MTRLPRWKALPAPRLVTAAVVTSLLALSLGGAAWGAAEPDDELFRAQWHLRAIGIPRAWEVSTGEGVVVAVLDTGVAYENDGPHRQAPDLAGTHFVPGWDFVDGDSHPDDVAVQGTGSHGTHIAGTIAQTTNNRMGGAGVAPGASIMPVRVLSPDGTGTSHAIALGLRFAADHGAQVANLSLGGISDEPEVSEAVHYASAKGVTIVVSSGDDGQGTVTFPAAYPEVLAVGAVRYDNSRTDYSNYGAALDLVAPGGDLEMDQNGDGLDDGIVQQTLYGQPGSFCFCFKEGTSSAAAHVSGVAALVIAAGKASTPAQVRDLLVSTATDLGQPGRDDEYGAGLVQATRALGLPPAPGEEPVASTHDHSTHDHGTSPEVLGNGHRQATQPTDVREFVLPRRSERAWIRGRTAGLAVVGGLVVGLGLHRVRRRNRRGDDAQTGDEPRGDPGG